MSTRTDDQVAALIERRRNVRLWWSRNPAHEDGAWRDADGPPPVGLALSGGGIRSATFSLGLIQALAKSGRGALDRIDVLSTVSGGGYAGCFLRSLFVPTMLRGIDPADAVAGADAKIEQYRLAHAALASDPCARELRPPVGPALRHPFWWLREHSRYLAPTGMTDYAFAVAYIARNWLAMIYLVLLACIALGAVLVGVEAGILALADSRGIGFAGPVPLSPVFLLGAIPIAAIAALMIAYWATQAMSTNERHVSRQRANLRKASVLIVAAAVAIAVLVTLVVLVAPGGGAVLGTAYLTIIGVGTLVALVGAGLAWAVARALDDRGALLTTELRRVLTGLVGSANHWLAIIAIVGTVDSLGAWLAWWARDVHMKGGIGVVALPVVAFFIKKLPDWFGGNGRSNPGGGVGGLLKRFATTVALAIGLLLYGMVAVAALALVHEVMWMGTAWIDPPHWWRLAVLAGIAWVLAVVLGRSTGFINLSSLHALYAARLSRAYLGASNVDRLTQVANDAQLAPVTENHARDYIQPRLYGTTDLPAPIHVINTTLNETIDPRSQIVSRDRKGDILSVEPDGIRVATELHGWDRLADPVRAENISLGQWIAISGAAASAGMGRMTSLGFALAFTFANVRLGYWWWSPRLCPDAPVVKGPGGWIARNFGTFVYLMNEMTCRYSRGYFRKYLTDGGHYENSGAYVLIRRRVPLILVTDNGADPDYAFADLETLVRQVRIDLGAETTIVGGADLAQVAQALGAPDTGIFVDPEKHPDWRQRMTDPTTPAFVLVLKVAVGGGELAMFWLKPRMLPGVPTDITGYQGAMKAFPQQPTGDQFFDEAQWESYRRLGELSMARLLDTCPALLASVEEDAADEDEVGGLVDVDCGEPEGARHHDRTDAGEAADPRERLGEGEAP